MRDPVDDEIDQPLHAYLHARGDVHPPDDLGDAVRLAMQTSPRRRWSTPLSGLAAAAVIVIAFGVAALALGPRMALGPGPLAATDAPSITLPPSAHGSTGPTSAAAGSPVARTSRPVGYPSAPGTLLLSLRSTKCAGALCDPTVTVFTLTAGGMVSCRSFEDGGFGPVVDKTLDPDQVDALLAFALDEGRLRDVRSTFTTFGAIPYVTITIDTFELTKWIDYPQSLAALLTSDRPQDARLKALAARLVDCAGASDAPTQPATSGDVPRENLALPVLSVGQLVDLIASGRVDGRAIAVGGYWADPGPVPCPYRPDEGFGNDCGLRVLMETDQKLGSSTGNGSSWGAPEPPFIRPYTMETTGLTSVTVDMSNGDPFVRPARRVVVIGHVGDPRAYGCTLTTVDDCRHRFVVDRVTWVDGKDVDLTAQFDPYVVRPTMTEADAIAAVESASPAGSPPLVVLGTTAAEAARVDPRIRVGVDGAVWIGRSLVGDPDADGTSTITETVVDDATGAVLQKQPLAVDPGYAPAVLTLVDDHGGEGNPDTGFVAVDLPDGTPLLTGSAGSFVVDAGDYSLRAWLAPMTQQGSDGPYVAGKPHDACERDVHVDALEHLAMTATWDGLDPCTWAKTRQP